MERDFLGLKSMEPVPASTVKLEISDEENQWPFMKKISSFPHFAQLKPSAFTPAPTTDAFDRSKISSMAEIQNFSLSLSNRITKPGFVGFGQNLSPMGQAVGLTEPWNNSNSSAPPPQMTIFYGGTVFTYEGLSPEKAQAIMILAGNPSFLGCNKNPMRSQPLAKKDEQTVAKTTEISKFEHQRGPISMSAMTPSAVPQFRKASLARFLEKRKERVMSAGPYTCKKKQADGVDPVNDNEGSAIRS